MSPCSWCLPKDHGSRAGFIIITLDQGKIPGICFDSLWESPLSVMWFHDELSYRDLWSAKIGCQIWDIHYVRISPYHMHVWAWCFSKWCSHRIVCYMKLGWITALMIGQPHKRAHVLLHCLIVSLVTAETNCLLLSITFWSSHFSFSVVLFRLWIYRGKLWNYVFG